MHWKSVMMYTIISIAIVGACLINETLLLGVMAVSYLVTTLFEFSEDWSLALLETLGTVIFTIGLGHTMGVTGFLIGMFVSIYGGLVVQWFIMKHFPWLSAQHRAKMRVIKAQRKALKGAA
jgi:hypothetical protein